MNLLEVTKKGLEINPHLLVIKEFKKIWTRDRSRNKQKAQDELAYVYYWCSPKSPYRKHPNGERTERIKIDIFDKDPKWKPDQVVQDACAKYIELTTSIYMELLQDAIGAANQLRKYFQIVDVTQLDDKGKPVYTAKDIITNMKQIGDAITGLKKLEEEVAKEEAKTDSKIRGGGQAGMFEDPD
jgi:hypothetical protein